MARQGGILIVSVSPSRIGVESYQAMKQELEELVGRIVGAYGNVHWTPSIYQFRNPVLRGEMVPLSPAVRRRRWSRRCCAAGMNLVAKEFIASRPDQTGVLILSEMAGAAKEMGEALIINPFHLEDFARTLEQALTMPAEEQVRRNQLLQERLRRYDVNRWADDFIQAMLSTQKTEAARQARLLAGKSLSALQKHYCQAARRVLFIDYDGTLVPFAPTPWQARPDEELLELLARLAADPRNEVVLVPARPSAARPGGLVRRAAGGDGGRTRRVVAVAGRRLAHVEGDDPPGGRTWCVDPATLRGPPAGSIAGGKDYSLGWHYRRADPDRPPSAPKLLDDTVITRATSTCRCSKVKKSSGAQQRREQGGIAVEWLAQTADFVLGIGDDGRTRICFRALPPTAHSVRV